MGRDTCFVLFLKFFGGFNKTSRISGVHATGRDIAGHNASGSNDYIITDSGVAENGCAVTDKYMISNADDADLTGAVANVTHACVMGQYLHI